MKHIRADGLFIHLCKLFEHDSVNPNVCFSAKMDDSAHCGHPYVEVDVRRMEQVVKNLISNALKHTKTCEISLRLFLIAITIK